MRAKPIGGVRMLGLLLGLSLVGCTAPSPTPDAVGPGHGDTGQASPAVNRVVMGIDPLVRETFEPRNVYPPGSWYMRPQYEYLVGVDAETGKLAPQLATGWAVEPDGQSVRLQLRKGVRFHGENGEFEAKDVAPVWKEMVKEDSLHGNPPYWRAVVKDIEVISDHEVVFRLSRADGDFYSAIGEAESGMEVLSSRQLVEKGPGTVQGGPVAGTAPYQFSGYVTGQYLRYQRVPYTHWRANPDFPEFEFRFMREASTRMAALLAGEVHMVNLPQDLVAQAEKQGMRTITGKVQALRNFFQFFGMFYADPRDPTKGYRYPDSPLMDIRVRQALNIGIDRTALNRAFFANKGQPLVINHFNTGRPGWNPEWASQYNGIYGHDPEKAKRLLAEAGYGPAKPLRMNLIVLPNSLFSGAEDVTEAVASAWRSIGVQPTLVTMEPSEFSNGTRAFRFDNHVAITASNSNLLLGSRVYNSSGAFVGGTGSNSMHDPEVDRQIRDIWFTLDEQEQARAARKLGDTLLSGYRNIPLFWLPAEMTVNPKVVADWTFPGSIFGTWGGFERIKAAR